MEGALHQPSGNTTGSRDPQADALREAEEQKGVSKTAEDNFAEAEKKKAEEAIFMEGYAKGYQSGTLVVKHDFSKDINSIMMPLMDYRKSLSEEARKMLGVIGELRGGGGGGEFEQKLKILEESIGRIRALPSSYWANLVLFKQMELGASTASVLTNVPAECVERINGGSLADLYEIIKTFVANNHRISNYYQQIRDAEVVAEQMGVPPDYSSFELFKSGEIPTPETKPFFEKLGRQVKKLLDLQLADKKSRFFMPTIVCPGVTTAEGETKDFEQKVFTGLQATTSEGLVPFLVYALRFAFQASYSKGILEELSYRVPIEVTQFGGGNSFRELGDGTRISISGGIKIGFELPLDEMPANKDEIPYLASFVMSCSRFSGLTYPWKEPKVEFVDKKVNIIIEYLL